MVSLEAPEIEHHDDWEPAEPFPEAWTVGSFIPRHTPDDRLLVRYFRDKSDGRLKAWAWFGPGAEGAPGRIHGGSVSAMMDEALGAAAWVVGIPVVTARLLIKYRNPLNVGTVCEIETRIVKNDRKRVRVLGTLTAKDGPVVAEAEGLYFRLQDSEISEKLRDVMAARRSKSS